MKIISWNVNGLRAAYKKDFLKWFAKEKPDILCLQETKVQEEQMPKELREIKGYNFYLSPAEKKGYSGVAIYSKEKPKSLSTTLDSKKFDREGRIQIADYGKFTLLNIYFPNGKASRERLEYKMDFYERLLEYVKNLKKQGEKPIICGDVNTAHKETDLARPKQNKGISGFLPQEREWINKLIKAGFLDTFRLFNKDPDNYTWWSLRTRARERNVGWRIDYFFADEKLKPKIKKSYIMQDVTGSDHCPICLELKK